MNSDPRHHRRHRLRQGAEDEDDSDPADSDAAWRGRGPGRRRRTRQQRSAWKVAGFIAGLMLLGIVAAGLFDRWMADPPRSVAAQPVAVPGGKPAERTASLPPLRLPADDALHASAMEWWYYSGILDGTGGQRHAFHVAVFVANGLVKHTVMHAALTDLRTGKRMSTQSRTGGVPSRHTTDALELGQTGWNLAVAGSRHALRLERDGIVLDLRLQDAHAPVLHRAAGSATPGLVDFGTSGISYYYSRPRMAATGQLTVDGKPGEVRAEVWFDHQWGDFDPTRFGWNWFALHLSDGSDLMLYELLDSDGRKVLAAGTLSDASGSRPLAPQDIELTSVERWRSPATNIDYPVGWRIRMPSGDLKIEPFRQDGEFDALATTTNTYWEGPVKVSGSLQGQGFMELSGYDRIEAVERQRR